MKDGPHVMGTHDLQQQALTTLAKTHKIVWLCIWLSLINLVLGLVVAAILFH